MDITDLIYDYEALPVIKKAYPKAVIEDATDIVHDSRFSVTIEADVTDWFEFLIREGVASISLWCQLAMRGGPRFEELKAGLERVQSGEHKSTEDSRG